MTRPPNVAFEKSKGPEMYRSRTRTSDVQHTDFPLKIFVGRIFDVHRIQSLQDSPISIPVYANPAQVTVNSAVDCGSDSRHVPG
jgi:hypothetical protein